MSTLKEVAKFLSGAEAFHALGHAYFWLAGTTLTVLGITMTPMWHGVSAAVNALIAIALGVFGWRARKHG